MLHAWKQSDFKHFKSDSTMVPPGGQRALP